VVRYYFGNVVPKGVTFDQIVPWAQFRLTWVERMVLRHRVYANAHDAARLHPERVLELGLSVVRHLGVLG
jgi:hypothetical protein